MGRGWDLLCFLFVLVMVEFVGILSLTACFPWRIQGNLRRRIWGNWGPRIWFEATLGPDWSLGEISWAPVSLDLQSEVTSDAGIQGKHAGSVCNHFCLIWCLYKTHFFFSCFLVSKDMAEKFWVIWDQSRWTPSDSLWAIGHFHTLSEWVRLKSNKISFLCSWVPGDGWKVSTEQADQQRPQV